MMLAFGMPFGCFREVGGFQGRGYRRLVTNYGCVVGLPFGGRLGGIRNGSGDTGTEPTSTPALRLGFLATDLFGT